MTQHANLHQDHISELTEQDIARIEKKVTEALTKAVEEGFVIQKNDPSRLTRLRMSGLPFCGVRWILDLPKMVASKTKNNFGMAYFTSVGTTIHTVFQAAIASVFEHDTTIKGFKVIRDWKCLDCGGITFLHERVDVCPHCKSERGFEPMEATLEDEEMLGHIDEILEFLLEVRGVLHKVWVVVDYKTTSTVKVNAKGVLPFQGNVSQISSYVSTLRKQGHPVIFAVLVYVPRDNPFKFKAITVHVDQKKEQKRISFYKEQWHMASRLETDEHVAELIEHRPCCEKSHKLFAECKWKNSCAGERNVAIITNHVTLMAGRMASMGMLPIVKDSE